MNLADEDYALSQKRMSSVRSTDDDEFRIKLVLNQLYTCSSLTISLIQESVRSNVSGRGHHRSQRARKLMYLAATFSCSKKNGMSCTLPTMLKRKNLEVHVKNRTSNDSIFDIYVHDTIRVLLTFIYHYLGMDSSLIGTGLLNHKSILCTISYFLCTNVLLENTVWIIGESSFKDLISRNFRILCKIQEKN